MKVKVLVAALMIATMPILQAALYQPLDDNVQDFYFFYLRTSQFEKLAELIKTSKAIDIPIVADNQYFYGNKLCEFSCFLGDSEHITEASNYWIKLISTAVDEAQKSSGSQRVALLDSTIFLVKSCAKSIPPSCWKDTNYLPTILQIAIAEKEKAQKKDS